MPQNQLTSKELVLSEREIRELTRLPEALQLVIDYHHHQETEADSLGSDGSVRFHEQRRKELETRRDELLTERGDKPGELLIVNVTEPQTSNQLSDLSVDDEIAMKVHISSAHARLRELAALLELRKEQMTPTCKALIAECTALIERGKQWAR